MDKALGFGLGLGLSQVWTLGVTWVLGLGLGFLKCGRLAWALISLSHFSLSRLLFHSSSKALTLFILPLSP